MSSIYVFQNRFQVTLNPLRIPFFRTCSSSPLAIQLAHHNIKDTEQGDEIRDLGAETNLLKRGDVDERWSADVIAPRIRLAVRDHVKAEFTFGRFDATIRFTRRDPDLILRFLGVDRPLGDLLDGLLQNPQGLPDLIQADQIVIVEIAVRAGGHVKLKAVIDAVRVCAADVIGHTL